MIVMSSPRLDATVGAIGFDFDADTDAWDALNPIDFSWTAELINSSLWFFTDELPNPEAIMFVGPSAPMFLPDGVRVEFARITFAPSGALGTWSLPADAIVADYASDYLIVKSGDPFVITVVPEPATAYLLAGAAFMSRRRRWVSR